MSKKELNLKSAFFDRASRIFSSRIFRIFSNGIIKENPVLRSALGLCPVLAVTASAFNGLGMGIATAFVLILSNMIISLLRKVIPDKVRIPAYIVVIAAFVTILQMLIRAFAPVLDSALGLFLPLIAVNCIIFGRAESFARKNKVIPSMIDGLGMGIGNTIALILVGGLREILGSGSLFGRVINSGETFETMQLFILPPGGLLAFAFIIAIMNKMAIRKGEEPTTLGCKYCPNSARCQAVTDAWDVKKSQICSINTNPTRH